MGLEIDHDPAYHRREYLFQIVGRAAIALVLLGAAAGLLGPGLFSRTTVRAQQADLAVTFERTLRVGAPVDLVVDAGADHLVEGRLHLRVSRSLLARMRLEGITPQPEEERASAAGVSYVVPIEEGEAARVVFDLVPLSGGWARGRVVVGEGTGDQGVEVGQFVFP